MTSTDHHQNCLRLLWQIQIVARARGNAYIIHLKEVKNDDNNEDDRDAQSRNSTRRPNLQRGLKGHIIIHPQRPERLDAVLPPSVSDIVTPICVIFVGAKPPTVQWLQENAQPLVVRREKVRAALHWLKQNNVLYKDLTIDDSRVSVLPEHGLLPLHIEHVFPNAAEDALTSRYDSSGDGELDSTLAVEQDKVVITDVDGRAPANELRAAAVRHIKEKSGGYVEIPHGPRPVNEFCNPDLFPMLYPSLFPYGIGGCEDPSRARPLSLKRHRSTFCSAVRCY
ncbi:hypothetical protein FKP32DRAFT_1614095 [Trametes sanguinea]|nr:hypothetical protein FKP32DRAFT_1614095 [Trametes sanguinea]